MTSLSSAARASEMLFSSTSSPRCLASSLTWDSRMSIGLWFSIPEGYHDPGAFRKVGAVTLSPSNDPVDVCALEHDHSLDVFLTVADLDLRRRVDGGEAHGICDVFWAAREYHARIVVPVHFGYLRPELTEGHGSRIAEKQQGRSPRK